MVYVWIENSPFQLKSEEGSTDFYHNERIIRDKFYASGKLSLVFLFHVCSHSDMPSITTCVLVILWFSQFRPSQVYLCVSKVDTYPITIINSYSLGRSSSPT